MAPRVAGLVLASGMSQRFGATNKLRATIGGVSLLERTVQAYVGAQLRPLLVVVGHEAQAIELSLQRLPVRFVPNPDYELGQSRALVRGIKALSDDIDAVVIGVGDQPFLTADIIRSLLDRYERDRPILVAPRYAGQRGNPVLFDRKLFPELLEVEGDQGGRSVMQRHSASIAWVEVADDLAAHDVDTPADLEEAQRAAQ